jgi:hypothetical protein
MKKILLIALTTVITGCGPVNLLNNGCGGEARKLCDVLFGPDTETDVKNNEEQIEELQKLIDSVISQVNSMDSLISLLKSQLKLLETNLENQNEVDSNLQNQISNLQTQIDDLKTETDAQQDVLNDATTEIAELQGYSSIVEYIDPCGDGSGFDEVILKTSDGSLLAYFEQGSKRHLSLIPDGQYRTTDNQQCYFDVVNGEIISKGSSTGSGFSYSLPSTASVSGGIQLTCILNDSNSIGGAIFRVRTSVDQNVTVTKGSQSITRFVETGTDTFYSFNNGGTGVAVGALTGSNTKACNN